MSIHHDENSQTSLLPKSEPLPAELDVNLVNDFQPFLCATRYLQEQQLRLLCDNVNCVLVSGWSRERTFDNAYGSAIVIRDAIM